MERKELIKKYIEFFKSKEHKEISNASLLRENDPTVLFTTAGMHPLVPFLLGENHPLGKRLVNVQRCIRTGDIEEVGDLNHFTFFEMLGNWSLGNYWKGDSIRYSYEFLTKILEMSPDKIAASVFKGDKDAPKDTESERIWRSLKVNKIEFLGKEDNWWGPAGATGPCGPDTEIFYWASKTPVPKKFNRKDNRWVEIWNNVFMQYEKTDSGKFISLKQKNVDTGMGVERTIAITQGKEDVYETKVFKPIISAIEELSKKNYYDHQRIMRIIADHIKASVFIISEEINPGNTEQGYVLRRLIRRAVRHGKKLELKNFTSKIAEPVFNIYDDYKELQKNKSKILETLSEEENKFNKTLEQGEKILKKLIETKKSISGKDAFLLYQSYGFPIELIEETAKEYKIKIDKKSFEKEMAKHRELSRTATRGKFKAGLVDNSKQTTLLHTATHLLHASLRKILGNSVEQKGSNITSERIRFDFSYPEKLTNQQIQKVESLVNEQIKKSLPITFKEMHYKEAIKTGALSFFRERYPEMVRVYSIGNFSKEICNGPHVKNTKEIGKFKITKEESSSAGVRRIKAIVE